MNVWAYEIGINSSLSHIVLHLVVVTECIRFIYSIWIRVCVFVNDCVQITIWHKICRTRVCHTYIRTHTPYLNDFLFYFIGQFILWCKVVLGLLWVNERWLMLMMLLLYIELNEPHTWYTIYIYFGRVDVLRAYKRFVYVYINMHVYM